MAHVKKNGVVGWREWAQLPDLGVGAIKVKVDTGARTSAIHAYDVHHFERDGTEWVRFKLHPEQKRRRPEVSCEAPLAGIKRVTSSNGQTQRRFFIKTRIKMGKKTFPIQLTLTNRDDMGFRMLLGRTALRRRFLVDCSKSFIQGKERPDTAGETS
ncbi:MAG: ATP-dependent zinc protease [Sphingomonas sp.]|nr:ATP-dependent zinc protease [Sphingomonas sp.]RZV53088.1 MAG: ATP-dependent zinc protease [Sphingomonadaceae bacterium]